MTTTTVWDSRRVAGPDHTTAMFVLLIAAVTATSSTTFYALQKAYPEWWVSETEAILAGLMLVFGLTGLLYWLTPGWMRRRRGLRRIEPAGSPELYAELAGLCAVAGVSTPVFLLAPKRRSTQAVAFGRLGRRYVRINAGLVRTSVLEPATFRAIILHELAHLRNRDVDIAMCTVSIWRAFLVVGLPLIGATAVRAVAGSDATPQALLGKVPVIVSLTVLTLLVYSTRNALLRLREHRADIRSAGWDARGGTPGPAARSALIALFARATARTGRLRRFRARHPRPEDRIAVIDNPALLLRPHLGHLFAAGVAAAVCMENSVLLFYHLMPGATNLSVLVNVLVVGAFLCLTLVFAVFRTARPAGRPPIRVMTFPLVLMAGFLVGDAAALINTSAGSWVMFGQYGRRDSLTAESVMVTVLLLVVGVLLITAWARSVASGVALEARRTWYLLAAVATVAVTPWFDLWFTMRSDVSQSLRSALNEPTAGPVPLPSAMAGWYTDAAGFIETLAFWPQRQLFFVGSFYFPGVVLGILLIAIVPLVLARRGGALRPDIGRAVRLGLAGTVACLLCFGLHLALVSDVYQPGRDRVGIEQWAKGGMTLFLAITVLVEAIVAGAVMASARRMPLVLATAAAGVTSTLTTVAVVFGYMPAHCAAMIPTMPEPCWWPAGIAGASEFWHYSLVLGVVASVPSTMAGAVIARIVRRRPGRVRPPAAPARRVLTAAPARRVLTVATGIVLVATLGAAGMVNLDRSVPLSPDDPDTVGECLIGRWRETSYRATYALDDEITFELRREGVVREFRRDGASVIDFGDRTVESAVYRGKVFALEHHGAATREFAYRNGSISYETGDLDGWLTISADGVVIGEPRRPLVVPGREAATCSGDTLTLSQKDYEAVLTRSG